MYEKDGEKYFVVDGHMHYWNAAPDNWVPGAEQYAKGWIECFHAYQGLGPADTHWTLEHFQKYSVDDFEHDVFENGHVDQAVFQSTYLKDWYTNGFNDIDQNAALLDRFGVPADLRPIGIIGFGYRADDEEPQGSWTKRRRRPFEEQVHRNGW